MSADRTCVLETRILPATDRDYLAQGSTDAALAVLVAVVSRAGALRRHHQRPHRTLGRAFPPKEFALRRLQHALQNLATLRCQTAVPHPILHKCHEGARPTGR